jgi:uncharacterized protein YbcI
MKFKEQGKSIKVVKHDWEIEINMYTKCKKDDNIKTDDNSNPAVTATKSVLDKARKAWDEVEARAEVVGAKIFQFHADILVRQVPLAMEKDC